MSLLTPEEIFAVGRELGLKCRLGGNPNIDVDYARAIEERVTDKVLALIQERRETHLTRVEHIGDLATRYNENSWPGGYSKFLLDWEDVNP